MEGFRDKCCETECPASIGYRGSSHDRGMFCRWGRCRQQRNAERYAEHIAEHIAGDVARVFGLSYGATVVDGWVIGCPVGPADSGGWDV